MKIVVSDITYYVEIRGKGSSLLFLHGFTGSSQNWLPIVSMFEDTYQCILIDILGHGRTDSPANSKLYDIEKVSRDIISILDELLIDNVTLIGYSMGGRLALALAINYPQRINKLILESSSPGLLLESERNIRSENDLKLANDIRKNGIEWFVNYWEQIPLFETQHSLSTEVKQAIRKQRLNNKTVGLVNSLIGMGTGSQPSYWDRLGSLEIPVLLICGEVDQKFCEIAKQMSKKLPNAKVEKITGVGHAIHVEHPKFFGKIVSEFL
ncbi:2-succinyl-6-hydroxy-2,4-cyclohexadiene-1-carboxylate synthase [Bacillus luteolus]|uniref:Putative 2-succinyl-6-hydroxy-2,4-cyclohexadiene-1-carboxylate synthase n=1 Tax=Litchfieldia luteola TaxID=682179 RepID=A0ABR9QIS8_9BACI|nr:2-succinyl-6-hydroxy-2,4-cyclohexadiene-1-carboxylate synthase [Cytobacillus luteolus]MBE4908407.1 2-succinyl-6-hydroxy-2,4-cyclohexadiene-1-carboxylate synthase [Cytobacillus luteolus]MBP1943195.1 2-succinyl-6-hydroxy-2,4-cyclohexadiene-1-carboxylate synthase [Cytobacillus luteolus]